MSTMRRSTPKDRFYAPLRKMATDYVPMLLGRMRVLENRAKNSLDFLDVEEEQSDDITEVMEAQTNLHRTVLEAGTCQALLTAFIDLLQDDRRKIIDNKCYFLSKDGEIVSLYGDLPPEEEDGFITGR
jgi:hypothetical protein|tara:strand:+ start:614 stop:997 length:384 start_codon:yes stop_codon:yes gene_type:complete